jgi:hypothetical protein
LEWGNLENVNRASLTDVGQVNYSGKVDVCLDATKTFVLQAVGAGGITEESIQITVQEPIGPGIEYLRVVPSIISPGGCAQLEWGKVERAISAEIEPVLGPVGTPGSRQVCPGGTTTYVLTANNPEASSTARTTLIVSEEAAQQPVIAFFTANPANLRAGECTTLSWGKVDYASMVTIDQGIGGVATPGSQELCLGSTTAFVMTAEGPGGRTEANLTIDVIPGERAELPDLIVESIIFDPNPCYRGQRCRVRVKVRNDGPVGAGYFVVRWAPSGEESVPVEWDVDGLAAGGETELTYRWIPSRSDEQWWTLAIADLNGRVSEIEEGAANILEQYVTVLEP